MSFKMSSCRHHLLLHGEVGATVHRDIRSWELDFYYGKSGEHKLFESLLADHSLNCYTQTCHQVGKALLWPCFCFPVCTSEIWSSFRTTWETRWYAKFEGQKKNTSPCCGRSSSTSIYCGSCKFFVAVIHLLASSCSHCCNSWIFFMRFETSIHPCTGVTMVP